MQSGERVEEHVIERRWVQRVPERSTSRGCARLELVSSTQKVNDKGRYHSACV